MNGIKEGTNFVSGQQQNQKNPGAVPKITMMSPEGEKLAAVSAPCDAYTVHTTSTAAVKEK
jgi:hypothetical protein